ncbi:uncharacterized protein LOC113296031 [Papaver somniferum]|uniref:uncharacterized protein LOC113296031 n=1 Tax=Papaver somniferum TaxID=3469 RepID=UPI000E6F6829|nr:uncharacterized protein LOC113296031 [Papaver somniferum]
MNFSTVEGINNIVARDLTSLSKQDFVDYDTSYNQRCNGGLMYYGFQFIFKKDGIDEDDPYKAKDGKCNVNNQGFSEWWARFSLEGNVSPYVGSPSSQEQHNTNLDVNTNVKRRRGGGQKAGKAARDATQRAAVEGGSNEFNYSEYKEFVMKVNKIETGAMALR